MNHLDLALFWKVAENIWLGHARDGISRPVKFCVKISARRRPPKLLKVRATPAQLAERLSLVLALRVLYVSGSRDAAGRLGEGHHLRPPPRPTAPLPRGRHG